MGCAASRVANEDVVRRCKERRSLMKEAVRSRHHLAAAHFDYLRSLRLTAAALSRFASFQGHLVVSHQAPHVLLHPTPAPPQRADKDPVSAANSPVRAHQNATFSRYQHAPTATPSQSSSGWNWESHYPPSPPSSEYFYRLTRLRRQAESGVLDGGCARRLPKEDGYGSSSSMEEGNVREEVRCSEWDDHYSGTSTQDDDEEEHGLNKRAASSEYQGSSLGSADYQASKNENEEIGPASVGKSEKQEEVSRAGDTKSVVKHKDFQEIAAALEDYFIKAAEAGDGLSGLLETGREQLDRSFRQLKKTVYHSTGVFSNLSSTLTSTPPLAVKYRLDTAALQDSGGEKSHCSTLEKLLAWEKKLYEEVKVREGIKIEHKKKLSALQCQEHKGRDDAKLDRIKTSIQRQQSLILVASQAASTTSSAIVKVRDGELAPQLVELCFGFMSMWRSMNQFHEVQSRIAQQVRGLVNNSVAAEPTSDPHRQATLDLESAASDWHSSFARLVKHHRDYVRSLYAWVKLTLVDATNDDPQKEQCSVMISSELAAFCDEWKQALERLPDAVAAEAIKSFRNVIRSVSLKQSEELKIGKRAEGCSQEVERKASALRAVELKFYRSYSAVGIGLPDGVGHDTHDQALDPLAEKRSEVAACRGIAEEEASRHAKAVRVTREMTLNSIQTGLSGVFQAMAGFSGLSADALEAVCSKAGRQR